MLYFCSIPDGLDSAEASLPSGQGSSHIFDPIPHRNTVIVYECKKISYRLARAKVPIG
jgi:hypothetical protein